MTWRVTFGTTLCPLTSELLGKRSENAHVGADGRGQTLSVRVVHATPSTGRASMVARAVAFRLWV